MRDDDVLLGLIAYQIRLVSAGSLAWFAQAVQNTPDAHLLDFLLEKRAINEADRVLLVKLADSIVRAHAGDTAAALETFGGANATAEAFARSVQPSEDGWRSESDETVVAKHLPHGLPRQIAPETVGRYTGGSEYARGGIGRILLVHDEQIGRDIILKELLPHRAVSTTDTTLSRIPTPDRPETPMRQSASMLLRFLREAKITGQLEHPSIVPVYELGLRTDGQLYYTMKLVRGDTLAVEIEKCTSIDDRIGLLRSYLDICQAMAYAHFKGVIHRDLKPTNIMLGEFGECVVLDWGLAQVQEDREAHDREMEKAASQLRLDMAGSGKDATRTEDVLGTPLYMSPEQARADADIVSYPSDVYSLGVILFELLSGELPHAWTNSLDTIRRVGTVPAPPLRDKAPNTPPELAAICDKALAFEATARYKNARELADDMERFLEGAVVKAYAYRTSDILKRIYNQHKPSILAGAAATAAILATGVLSYIQIYNARGEAVDAQRLAEDQRVVAESERTEAERQRALAESERERAAEAELLTAKEKYVSDIRLADAYLRDQNYRSAESTLLSTDPRHRNFEWNYLLSQCNLELATLGGHANDVFARISSDGLHILTISGDQTAKLWNAASGVARHTWELPGGSITGGDFSPDSTQLAIWTYDGTVRLFDTTSGASIREWRAHNVNITTAAFSSDGVLLATTGDDGVARIWKVDPGDLIAEIALEEPPIISIGFAGADRYLVAIRWQTAPEILDVAQGVSNGRIPAAPGRSWLAGDYVLVSAEEELQVFSIESRDEIGRIVCGNNINSADYDPAQNTILTGADDGAAVVWDGSTGERIQSFNFGGPIYACEINAAADTVVVASVSGRIRLYDLESGAQLNEFGGHWEDLTTVEIAPDDTYLLTGSRDGTARKWSMHGAHHSIPLAQSTLDSYPASLTATGDRAVWSGKNGKIQVRDLPGNTPAYTAVAALSGRRPVTAMSSDGKLVAFVLDGLLPILLTPENGNVVATMRGHTGYITDIQFNREGTELLTTSWDGTARLWNARTGESLGVLEGHTDTVYSGVFAPDGATIITNSGDTTAVLWDRQTLSPRHTFQHDLPVVSCAIANDGTLAATGSRDGQLFLWELPAATLRHTLDATSLGANRLFFDAAGKRLIACGGARTPAVWDAEMGLLLTSLAAGTGTRPMWHDFHAATDTHYYVSGQGLLLRHVALALPEQPVRTRQDLEPVLAAYRQERQGWPELPAPSETAAMVNTYLPSTMVTEFIDYLRAASVDTSESSPVDGSRFFPLALQAGDTVTTVAGLSTEMLFAESNDSILQALLSGARTFEVDVLRNGAVSRYRLHPIEPIANQRTIALSHSRAVSLLEALREALENLSSNLSEFHALQLERDGIPGEDGIWIPVPRDAAHKALLLEAGLEPQVRISAINGESISVEGDLLSRIEAGLAHLENNSAFTIQLDFDRGMFEAVQLTIQNEG